MKHFPKKPAICLPFYGKLILWLVSTWLILYFVMTVFGSDSAFAKSFLYLFYIWVCPVIIMHTDTDDGYGNRFADWCRYGSMEYNEFILDEIEDYLIKTGLIKKMSTPPFVLKLRTHDSYTSFIYLRKKNRYKILNDIYANMTPEELK